MDVSLYLLAALGLLLLIPIFGADDGGDDDNEILGSSRDDLVNGTEGNDLIRTFRGEDEIYGNGGNDQIFSDEDDDYIEGGDGLDYVKAGPGNDEVYGNDQDDRLFGDQGDDYLDGGRGADVVRGGRGDDLIFGGSSNLPGQVDQLSGEDDDDTIFGWGDGTILNGGSNDIENPGSNDDTLIMVTGEGIMTNSTGFNTNIGLANIQDDDETEVVVNDFDLEDDNLVLTVDYNTTGTPMDNVDADFRVDYSFVAATSERGAGMEVTLTWLNPDGDVTQSESASAFLLGYSAVTAASFGLDPAGGSFTPGDVAAPFSVDAYLTQNASLTDPIATLDQIGITTTAIDVWRTT